MKTKLNVLKKTIVFMLMFIMCLSFIPAQKSKAASSKILTYYGTAKMDYELSYYDSEHHRIHKQTIFTRKNIFTVNINLNKNTAVFTVKRELSDYDAFAMEMHKEDYPSQYERISRSI